MTFTLAVILSVLLFVTLAIIDILRIYRPRFFRKIDIRFSLVPRIAGGGPVPPPDPPIPAATPATSVAQVAPVVLTDVAQVLITAEKGWTTTEFWVTVVSMVIGLLTLMGVVNVDVNDPNTARWIKVVGGALAVFVPAVAYTLGRSIRKRNTQG